MKHFIEIEHERIAILVFDTPPQMDQVTSEIKNRFGELYQKLYSSERFIQKLTYQIDQMPAGWNDNPEWVERHNDLYTNLQAEKIILKENQAEYDTLGSTPVPLYLSLVDVVISPMFGKWGTPEDIRCRMTGNEWRHIADTIADLEKQTTNKTIPLSEACDMMPY